MRQNILLYLLLTCCITFIACNTTTPERYFDITVLNSNMVVGFAGDGQQRELDSPSAIGMDSNNQPISMKRKEVIDQKIQFLDEDLKDIKDLKETADTKEMVQASKKLYEYILPVYKNEYTKLAASYDNGASKEAIQADLQAIHDKYHAGFEELYNKLIAVGKSYASKHNIKVNWAD